MLSSILGVQDILYNEVAFDPDTGKHKGWKTGLKNRLKSAHAHLRDLLGSVQRPDAQHIPRLP